MSLIINIFLIFFVFFFFIFNAKSAYGPNVQELQKEKINLFQSKEKIELEQVILFKVVDEHGFEKESVTSDERKIIEKKVKEYEKTKKITDRAGKVYIINNKPDVISVEKIKK